MKNNEIISRKRFYVISLALISIMVFLSLFSYEIEALSKDFPSVIDINLVIFTIFLLTATYYSILKRIIFPKEIILLVPLILMALIIGEGTYGLLIGTVIGIAYFIIKKYLNEKNFSIIVGCLTFILSIIVITLILFEVYSKSQETPISCEGLVPDRIANFTAQCISNFENTKCNNPRDFSQCYLAGNKELRWEDGTPMSNLYLRRGCYNGENKDYLYGSILYLNWIHSVNGSNREVQYTIDLTLDSKDKTESGYRVVESRCRKTSYYLD